MTAARPDWLIVKRRDAPLIVSIPHAGTELLGFEPAFVDPWLAREDADWRLDELYDFVAPLGATLLRPRLSRSIIDVNRDPSGASLYPGQATTELVPTTTFDGESLYRQGRAPDALKSPSDGAFTSIPITRRSPPKSLACASSISASRCSTPTPFAQSSRAFSTVNCPCSISSSGASCGPELRETIGAALAASKQTSIVDGRFKGGWITRAYGRPREGVEALQLELACRAYMHEPERPAPDNWPTPIDEKRATPTRATLKRVLEAMLEHVSQ
jgi:N-formylglutamate deformylase